MTRFAPILEWPRALSWIAILVLLLTLGLAPTALAEEAEGDSGSSEPAPEPEPTPEPEPEVRDDRDGYTQEEVFVAPEIPAENPTPEYVPPAEASEGVGGWAVVDPETGNVHGVLVCTIDVCGPQGDWGGRMPSDYMGCGTNCVLRFQSKADDSGNVSGYHGSQFNQDGSSSTDGSVKWNEDQSNFSLRDGLGRTSTLIPERTDGRGPQSGLVDIVQRTETSAGVKIEQRQETVYDQEVETDVLFPSWGQEGRLFTYLSQLEAESKLQADIDSSLLIEGYAAERTTTELSVDEETGEETTIETTESVVDEDNAFVVAVREWTRSVVDFFSGFFS